MKPLLTLFSILILQGYGLLFAQNNVNLKMSIQSSSQQIIDYANLEIKNPANDKLIKSANTDENGLITINNLAVGDYIFNFYAIGLNPKQLMVKLTTDTSFTVFLQESTVQLKEVSVSTSKQLLTRSEGKTIINVDASPTNVGTTVLEALEKSPGVSVDRDGGISMQGKNGVLVLIDDKQTYLSGNDLNNFLNAMNTSDVSSIELITSPTAKYDANGNAGIINIKTKKSKQKGTNGAVQLSAGQGKYAKSNNSLQFNYNNGKLNTFINYNYTYNKNFSEIFADRDYFNADGSLMGKIIQPSMLIAKTQVHQLKTGLDYYFNENNTLGITLTGLKANKSNTNYATAEWMNAAFQIDSAVVTSGYGKQPLKNNGLNFYGRHQLSKAANLGFDIDYLSYHLENNQYFSNTRSGSEGYFHQIDGSIPSDLKIFTTKTDYSYQFDKAKLEIGAKFSNIKTDNAAVYQKNYNGTWKPDYDKTNQFIYTENISSAYGTYQQKYANLDLQLGLRLEHTDYTANQLGNLQKPGDKLTKDYLKLFPSGRLSYQANENNGFEFIFGRRIDRPSYQNLNPFIFVINKYTYQKGNPDIRPQTNWNMELNHQFKKFLNTSVSYSVINDFFSQYFINETDEILLYTQGNVGKAHQFGIGVTLQLQPLQWWNLTLQSNYNHKRFKETTILNYKSSINQLHSTLNTQFKLSKTLNAEVNGNYTTRARTDLQELLYPTGQLAVGISKSIFKQSGSIKLSARDIFYSQAMEGITDFPNASEYFILKRDTRTINLAFTYRFGKPIKAVKRSGGGATDEINRAGT